MLRKLPRYVLRDTISLYALGVAAVCVLLMIDTLAVLATFIIQYDVSLGTTAQLLLYRIPYFLHLALPIAVVFAVLLSVGRMAKDSELKAAYASGVPPRSLLWPLVLFGIGASVLSLANNGLLEARGNQAYQAIVDSFIYIRPPAESRTNVAYQVNDTIYFAMSMTSTANGDARLERVLITSGDEIIAAPSGTWVVDDNEWVLSSAEVSVPGEETRELFDSYTVPFTVGIGAEQLFSRTDELPLDQLWQQRSSLAAVGGDTSDLDYEFHSRVADSLNAIFFATIAATVALRVQGRGAGFAWTIVLMVAFWGFWTVSASLYDSGTLSAIPAAWLVPAVTAVISGAVVFLVVRK